MHSSNTRGQQMPTASVTITLAGALDDGNTDLTDLAAMPELLSSTAKFGTTEDIHTVAISTLNAAKASIIRQWEHEDGRKPYRTAGAGYATVIVELVGAADVPEFEHMKIATTTVETSGDLGEALMKATFAMVDTASGWLRDRKDATKATRAPSGQRPKGAM